MNKNRLPLDKQLRKKQDKEIKKGQKLLTEPEQTPRTDTLTPAKALEKYPAKRQKVEKSLMDAVVENMEIKKKKSHVKHSKRTNTDLVDFHESPPAHIHPEGKRWGKTLVKQSVGKGKALTAKIQKRTSRAPKGKR